MNISESVAKSNQETNTVNRFLVKAHNYFLIHALNEQIYLDYDSYSLIYTLDKIYLQLSLDYQIFT